MKKTFSDHQIRVPQDFPTLAQALQASRDGNEILLSSGKYLLSEPLIIEKNVILRGENSLEDVMIILSDSSLLHVSGGNPEFQNISFLSAGINICAVFVTGGKPTFSNCEISTPNGGGVVVEGNSADPVFNSVNINACENYGILIHANGKGFFKNCEISECHDDGIEVRTGGNPVFEECRIFRTRANGCSFSQKARGRFIHCDFFKNEGLPFLPKYGWLLDGETLVSDFYQLRILPK